MMSWWAFPIYAILAIALGLLFIRAIGWLLERRRREGRSRIDDC